MKTVNQYTTMKSGDKFIYGTGAPDLIYTLQKFPDFNLWMLISEHHSMWMEPTDTTFGAFGGWHDKFTKV